MLASFIEKNGDRIKKARGITIAAAEELSLKSVMENLSGKGIHENITSLVSKLAGEVEGFSAQFQKLQDSEKFKQIKDKSVKLAKSMKTVMEGGINQQAMVSVIKKEAADLLEAVASNAAINDDPKDKIALRTFTSNLQNRVQEIEQASKLQSVEEQSTFTLSDEKQFLPVMSKTLAQNSHDPSSNSAKKKPSLLEMKEKQMQIEAAILQVKRSLDHLLLLSQDLGEDMLALQESKGMAVEQRRMNEDATNSEGLNATFDHIPSRKDSPKFKLHPSKEEQEKEGNQVVVHAQKLD